MSAALTNQPPSAELEFGPCEAVRSEYALVVTTWDVFNSETKQPIAFAELNSRDFEERYLEDSILPCRHMRAVHESPADRHAKLQKHGLEKPLGFLGSKSGAGIIVDLGIVVRRSEIPRGRVPDVEDSLHLPSVINFTKWNAQARLRNCVVLDDAVAISTIFGGMNAGAVVLESDEPPWYDEEKDDGHYAPREGETIAEFLARIFLPVTKIHEEFTQLALCGNDRNLDLDLRERRRAVVPSIRFLVAGLIATDVVTLFGGRRKAGKSTAVTELAVVAAAGGGQWAGFEVRPEACAGFVLLFCGEDSQAAIHERVKRMQAGLGGNSPRLIIYGNDETDLGDRLAEYQSATISLIIVDPSRKYYSGDEDGSDAPNELFNILEQAAVRHRCAVVVTHHPRKDARPNNLSELAGALRGSALWLDRPRTVLGLLHQHNETIIGIPTESGGSPLHNFPAEMMYAGQRRLRRDESTHRLIPIDRPEARTDALELNQVLSALDQLAKKSNDRVTKSGKRGLFEMWPEELDALPRARVHAACDALLAEGKLILVDGALSRPS